MKIYCMWKTLVLNIPQKKTFWDDSEKHNWNNNNNYLLLSEFTQQSTKKFEKNSV